MTGSTHETNETPWLEVFWAAVQAAYDAILITDAELEPPGPRILEVNQAFCRMTGYTRADVLGQTPRILQGLDTDREVLDRLKRDLTAGREFEGRTTNYRKDGTPFELEWTVAPVRSRSGLVTHYVAIQRDVTERQRLFDALREQAMVDSLTNTFNRRYGERVLDAEVKRSLRHGDPLAVVMIDIDHFKALNDALGHVRGDAILERFTDVLAGRLRSSDTLCRWGGEEFLAVLPNTTREGAVRLAEDLRARVAATDFAGTAGITASFGVAVADAETDTLNLVATADDALYAAKAAGRDGVACADTPAAI